MDFWLAIVLIVLIGCTYLAVETYVKRHKNSNFNDLVARIEKLEQAGNSQDLQDRVANLERIVTDKKSTLSDDIDNL